MIIWQLQTQRIHGVFNFYEDLFIAICSAKYAPLLMGVSIKE